jgi:hypothetical protein
MFWTLNIHILFVEHHEMLTILIPLYKSCIILLENSAHLVLKTKTIVWLQNKQVTGGWGSSGYNACLSKYKALSSTPSTTKKKKTQRTVF